MQHSLIKKTKRKKKAKYNKIKNCKTKAFAIFRQIKKVGRICAIVLNFAKPVSSLETAMFLLAWVMSQFIAFGLFLAQIRWFSWHILDAITPQAMWIRITRLNIFLHFHEQPSKTVHISMMVCLPTVQCYTLPVATLAVSSACSQFSLPTLHNQPLLVDFRTHNPHVLDLGVLRNEALVCEGRQQPHVRDERVVD